MDRRSFLTGATLVAAAGVAGPASAAVASQRTVLPVISWELSGGFVGPGFTELRPPQLAIYPDGWAIVDAEKQLRLRRSELDDLLRRTVAVLRDPANGRRRPGAPVVADAPATVFTARDSRRRYRIQAEALGESRDFHAYPAPMYDLLDRFTAVRDRVTRTGQDYRVPAVRLVAVRADGATGAIAWPRTVRVPQLGAVSGSTDLQGPAATEAIRRMPRRNSWDWQVYRTADGRLLRATWRYLLPDER